MDATTWWLLAGAAVVAELLTGTFFLLMLGLGLAAGAVAAMAGAGEPAQWISAAVVGAGAVAGWGVWRRRRPRGPRVEANPDVVLDIGAQVQVERWQEDGMAVVRYRGAPWLAEPVSGPAANIPNAPNPPISSPTPTPHATIWRVVAVRGNHLIIEPVVPTAVVPATSTPSSTSSP